MVKESLFDGYELKLTKQESEDLIERLLNPKPNKKRDKFIRKCVKFYKQMKVKEDEYKRKNKKDYR